MLVLASARDLLTLLVALEVVSLPAFVLVGMRRGDPRGAEASFKFFLFSVVSTAFTVYGIALVYGVTGSIELSRVASSLGRVHAHTGAMSATAAAGVVLVLVGFAFKVAAVPFHFWAPDTYQGAPVPVAAFLSVASKAAGFAGLIVLLEGPVRLLERGAEHGRAIAALRRKYPQYVAMPLAANALVIALDVGKWREWRSAPGSQRGAPV